MEFMANSVGSSDSRQRLEWLDVPEYRDAVYVRRTAFPHGYAIEYISPAEYGNLSGLKNLTRTAPGLFFWKSVGKVKTAPQSPETYMGYDKCFETGSESAFWYPETSFQDGRLIKLESYEQPKERSIYR